MILLNQQVSTQLILGTLNLRIKMTELTMDNTEGYTQIALDVMNDVIDEKIAEMEIGPEHSQFDNEIQDICESVLKRYDTQ